MAKKRATKKKSAPPASRVPRKTPYTSDELGVVVQRLRELAAQIGGLAKAMDDSGVESVVVDGHAMLLRGFNQIANFADNASRAVREERTRLEHGG